MGLVVNNLAYMGEVIMESLQKKCRNGPACECDGSCFVNEIGKFAQRVITINYPPLYFCSKHGEVSSYFYIQHSGDWRKDIFCTKCYVEKLDEIGVCRMEEK